MMAYVISIYVGPQLFVLLDFRVVFVPICFIDHSEYSCDLINFPRITAAQSFKPIWNVRVALIDWKVSAKKIVKIHIYYMQFEIYNWHCLYIPIRTTQK